MNEQHGYHSWHYWRASADGLAVYTELLDDIFSDLFPEEYERAMARLYSIEATP
jgi:hypothetical protein